MKIVNQDCNLLYYYHDVVLLFSVRKISSYIFLEVHLNLFGTSNYIANSISFFVQINNCISWIKHLLSFDVFQQWAVNSLQIHLTLVINFPFDKFSFCWISKVHNCFLKWLADFQVQNRKIDGSLTHRRKIFYR